MLLVIKGNGTLTVDRNDLQVILEDFGIREKVVGAGELLRYDYKNDPAGKNVRLMLKCLFADREPVAVKLKHEDDVTEALLAEQIGFFGASGGVRDSDGAVLSCGGGLRDMQESA